MRRDTGVTVPMIPQRKAGSLNAEVVFLAAIVVAPSACNIIGKVCSDEFVYGVHVNAVDSVSGTAVQAGLNGSLLQSSYSEEMQVFGNDLFGAGERAGVYSVVVNAAGYETWVSTGVRVRGGDCHVVPVDLKARLLESTGR